jgi:hypothetical protein
LKTDDKTRSVTFDTKGLDLSKNEGAKLLNDVIGSKNTYEFSEGQTVNTSSGLQRIDSIKTIPQYIANLPIFSNKSGDSRQPRAGVADVAGIDVDNGRILRTQVGVGVSRFWTVAFHELAEAYEKNDNRQSSYEAGRKAALQRETNLRDQRPYLKQNAPGAGGPGTGIMRQ